MTSHFECLTFCTTQTGNSSFSYRFSPSTKNAPRLLVIGGVHGDEPEGVCAARGLLKSLLEDFSLTLAVTLLPEFNIDGVLNKDRRNAAGVDLNRNLPTLDWSSHAASERYSPGPFANSELENQALVSLLNSEKFDLIVSLHSWNPMINVNGNCEPEATLLAQEVGYKIESDIGYPTPGSLGTYAGKERGIPTITYEIQRDLPFDQIHRVHVPALIKMLKLAQNRKPRE